MIPDNKNPCSPYLSDRDYLLHMIPHHQVAIDVSNDLSAITKNPVMIKVIRELIWTQTREIQMMEDVLKNLPANISDPNFVMSKQYQTTIFDFVDEATDLDAECKMEFFNPEIHKQHMSHMDLNDKTYLEHMIPHHQVAVDMSKRLLKYSNNDFMIHFAYRIIRSQQNEINLMHQLLNSWSYNSNLL